MSDIRKRTGKKGTTYQVRYPDKSTKTGYAFKTFSTLKEARAFREDSSNWKGKIKSNIRSVDQAVQLWLNVCEKIGRDGREKVEPQTLVEYERRGKVIKNYRWQKELQSLDPSDIVHFSTWLLEHHTRDLARRTLSSFHSILLEMKTQGHIAHDPAAGITIRSDGRYEDNEVQIPSDSEIRNILAAIDSMANKNEYMKKSWARYRPMIYLAVFSGLRPSEYRGLTWDNVTQEGITVSQRADQKGRIGPVKSKAGKRTIYLPRIVTDMIFEWKPHCPDSVLNLVFPTKTGKPQLLGKIRMHAWLPLLQEAGLITNVTENGKIIKKPKYKMNCLRHYFASKLIEKGTNAKFIQKVMGHSSIEITYNVYGHLIEGRDKIYQDSAEELAADILGKNSCGKSVARTL